MHERRRQLQTLLHPSRQSLGALGPALSQPQLGEQRPARCSASVRRRPWIRPKQTTCSPNVIVLDEPFAGLDPIAVAELSATLRRPARGGAKVLFSSHHLDLVQDLCEDIVMVHDGRTVLVGDAAELRLHSGERQLRLTVRAPTRAWLAPFPGVRLVSEESDELRLAVPPGVDALEVLDAARAAGPVTDFGLDLPTLSQLFLRPVGREDEEGP